MTDVRERTHRRRARRSSAPRQSRSARWRVAGRLARRQVRRAWVSTLLITILVALPIAAMTAYAVFAASMLPTADERIRVELGRMQAWVAPAGVPGAGFWQAPTDPAFTGYPISDDGVSTMADGVALEDPTDLLPAGGETILLTKGSVRAATASGIARVTAWSGPAWDERFTGAFDLSGGSRPSAPDEAAATSAALERLGIGLGDDIRLADDDRTFRITGILDAATLPDAEAAVFLPASGGDLVGGEKRWYLPEATLTWPDVLELNEQGVVALSRAVLADPPTSGPGDRAWGALGTWQSIWTTYTVLVVGGVFAAYVVIMLAGAAFAVTARRQQRALAVAASVGAGRRDLFRTILLQGTTLGALGGAVGIAIGVAVTAVVMAVTSDGSATQFWGFHVPWPILGGVLLFAVVVGTVSALVPARTVARTDAIRALRGSRRPQRPTQSRPVWGAILLVAGVALTIVSALVWLAANGQPQTSAFSLLRTLPPYGIMIGPIVVQIGILLSGRWLLWMLSTGLSHAGMAARLASRDAAANAGRTVPAFAAIAATVFVGVFAFAQSAMQAEQSARMWFYDAPVGSLAVSIWPGSASPDGVIDADVRDDAASVGLELADAAGASDAALVSRQRSVWQYPDAASVPDDATHVIAVLPDDHLLDPEVTDMWTSMGQDPGNPLSVVDADGIETVLGIDLSPADLARYRDGAAIVADARFATDGAIDVAAWAGRDAYEGRVPDNVWIPFDEAPTRAEPVWTERVDAIVVDAPLQPTAIAISSETADSFGIEATPERVIAALPSPLSASDRDRLQAQAQALSTGLVTVHADIEEGPPSQAAWTVPLLTAVAVLVLGASAVALGLARFERRPDDATLAAVGATRGLRRGIAFWQGLIVAGFGTIAGVAAGILPPIGFSLQAPETQRLVDVPWWLLAVFALGLPLVVALSNAAVPPRHPDLTRRTAIA